MLGLPRTRTVYRRHLTPVGCRAHRCARYGLMLLLLPVLGWAHGQVISATSGQGPSPSPTASSPSSLAAGTASEADALADLLQVNVDAASRYAQPLAETPAAASVLPATDWQLHGETTLAEALSGLRGLHLSNDRNYTYLGLRGLGRPGDYNSRVLLLVDGSRHNDPIYDQAYLGHDAPVDLDWIKRLEFVPGPASAQYGANAFLGIIQAVTYDGGDLNGTRVLADAGSGRHGRVGVMAGYQPDAEREWFAAYSGGRTPGGDLYLPAHAASNGGWARGLDAESWEKAYFKYRWGGWRLSAQVNSREKDLPTGAYGSLFAQPGTRTLDQSARLELAYDGELASGWQQQARLSLQTFRFNGDYRFLDADNRDQARAQSRVASYQLQWQGMTNHRWVVGVEAQHDLRLLQRNFDVSGLPGDPDAEQAVFAINRPEKRQGFYLQDEWRLAPQWRFNAGVRHDLRDGFAAQTSPRLALIYRPLPRLALKTLLGQAYRPPNQYERYYTDGEVLQKANPALQPERIRSAELVAELALGQEDGKLHRLSAGLFDNRIKDLIDQVTDPQDGLLVFRNQQAVRVQGVETEYEAYLSSGMHWRANLSWQEARLVAGGRLANAPRLLANLRTSWPLGGLGWPGWTAAADWQGLSSRRSASGARVPGAGLVHLTLISRDLGDAGQWRLTVRNLFDQRLLDPVDPALTPVDTLLARERQWQLRWQRSL